MGLILFCMSTLVASVVPSCGRRGLLYLLLTVGALFPLGYLVYGIAVLEAGREPASAWPSAGCSRRSAAWPWPA